MPRGERNLERRIADRFGARFTWQMKDAEMWRTVRDTIREYVERYGEQARQHEGLFEDACKAAVGVQNVSIAVVLDEFGTLCIRADTKRAKEEARARELRSGPVVAETTTYVKGLVALLEEFTAGKSTRGEFLDAVDIVARNAGVDLTDLRAEEPVPYLTAVRDRWRTEPGGLDGKVGPNRSPFVEALRGATA